MNLANFVTLGRLLIVPFFFVELVTYKAGEEFHRQAALWLFCIAAASDALDGAIARLTNTQTELGRFLDPLADKLLLLSGFIGLLWVDSLPYRPPLWFTATVIFRDILMVLCMFSVFLVTGKLLVQPSILGKLTTAGQMLTLISVLLRLPVSEILWTLTGALTILSFLFYLKRDIPKLNPGKS